MSEKTTAKTARMPVGVVLRRAPGVTRWARWVWTASAVLPGAGPGQWRELRRDGDSVEYHAGTVDMELHRTETEAYIPALANTPPLLWVILRPDAGPEGRPEILTVTASAYEAQDYGDNGEDLVEPLPMPEGVAAWVSMFVREHHTDEEFRKRKRRPYREDEPEDGIGDARVRQVADVYRTPGSMKARNQ